MYPQYANVSESEINMDDNTSVSTLMLSDGPETVYDGAEDDPISDYSAVC